MYINREEYDLSPLLIKQGALSLWGTCLVNWTEGGHTHHIYRLNDFYADVCFDEKTGRLASISTFLSLHWLTPHLDRKQLR
jgi:hypothetical protein